MSERRRPAGTPGGDHGLQAQRNRWAPRPDDPDILATVDQLGRLGTPRRAVRRLLPDPTKEAGWRRTWHGDLATLTPRARYVERLRLERLVASAATLDEVPTWVWDRLEKLTTTRNRR